MSVYRPLPDLPLEQTVGKFTTCRRLEMVVLRIVNFGESLEHPDICSSKQMGAQKHRVPAWSVFGHCDSGNVLGLLSEYRVAY